MAKPTLTYVGDDLTSGPYSVTADGSTFTFSSTGDIFNPLAVSTAGGGEVSSFGGFLGIPVIPSTDFTNRGSVSYGPGPYAAFPTTTEVPYSNGANFLGLEAISGSKTFYGFAYTSDATLVGYGFESTPGTAITAITSVSAAPEPSTWLLMFAGIGGIGLMLRRAKQTMGFRLKDAFAA